MAAQQANRTLVENSFWDFKGKFDFADEWFLMRWPGPVVALVAYYLLFVLVLGPRFMKNRPAYKLNGILVVYNVAQVCISSHLFFMGFKHLWKYGLINSTCLLTNEENRRMLAAGIYTYFCAKISEFLDTIFFVLRKKQDQISFLHVYHHALMMFATWMTLKYDPSDSCVFLGTINSFIHIMMYGYYCLSAIPKIRKYLWWKKYITTLQVVQFVCIIIQIIISNNVSECPPSYLLLCTIIINGVFFIILFTKFYNKAYTQTIKSSRVEKTEEKFKCEKLQ